MKRSICLFLLIVSMPAAGIVMPGCSESEICTPACIRADQCLAEIGHPIQDIYNDCILPCNSQNPFWKACVLECDRKDSCAKYAVCLFYCGYWR